MKKSRMQSVVALGTALIALWRQQGAHNRPAAEWSWRVEEAWRDDRSWDGLQADGPSVFPWNGGVELINSGVLMALSVLVPLGLFLLIWARGPEAVSRRRVAACAVILMALFGGPAAVCVLWSVLRWSLSVHSWDSEMVLEEGLRDRWLFGPASAAVALIAARWLPQPTAFRDVLVCAGAGVGGGMAGAGVVITHSLQSEPPLPLGYLLLLLVVPGLVASPYSGLWGGLVGAALAFLREPLTVDSLMAISGDGDPDRQPAFRQPATRSSYRQPAIPLSESTDDQPTRDATVAKLVSTAGTMASVFVCVATVLMGQTPYAREMGLLVCSSLAVVVITACARAEMIGTRAPQ